MPYDSEQFAAAIIAQARATAKPAKKNWGNPAPLLVIHYSTFGRQIESD